MSEVKIVSGGDTKHKVDRRLVMVIAVVALVTLAVAGGYFLYPIVNDVPSNKVASSETFNALTERANDTTQETFSNDVFTLSKSKLSAFLTDLEAKAGSDGTFLNYFQLAAGYYRLDNTAKAKEYSDKALAVTLEPVEKQFYASYISALNDIKSDKAVSWLTKATD